MKRKFFTLMVAACAAVFSFAGLTGCSGGGEEEDNTAGYVTYRQWCDGTKGFQIGAGAQVVYIRPLDDQSTADYVLDKNKYTSPVQKRCMLSAGLSPVSGELVVNYQIVEWVPGETAGADALPSKATLKIYFTESTQMTNKDILGALGIGHKDAALSSGVTLTLYYTSPGSGGRLESTFKYFIQDGSEETIDYDGTGEFFVGKNI